jgi:uncharacterized protein DUF2799
MKLRLSLALAVLSGCATADVSNLAAYCAPENAFVLGTQSRAYFGVCPKETEAAFLAGLERGRGYRPNTPSVYPYIEQMRTLERQLVATSSEAERQQLRARLTDVEWWAIHLMSAPGSYGVGQ